MRRFLLLLVLLLLVAVAFWFSRDLGWDTLARNQGRLLAQVGAHPVAAATLFLAAYVLTAALSLPHAALLTVTGGLLFGAALGAALTVTGATIGACILLAFLRSAFSNTLNRQRHRIPETMRARLARDGFSYLLAIRLVPLFPFWIVNLAAAVAGIRLAVFAPATLIGIAPVSFVLSWIGADVGSVLAEGGTPDLSLLFKPNILLPLLALAMLALVPALVRRRSHA
jgi:uncharacterized membrane protein YdjX (TVP38/TMEM64 family)